MKHLYHNLRIMLFVLSVATLIFVPGFETKAASSASYQASVSSRKYTTLKEAVANVQNGQTIKILQNIKLSETITCNKNVSFNLNLNKHTIQYTEGDVAFHLKRGKITVSNGTWKASYRNSAISSPELFLLENKATLVVKNGTFKANSANDSQQKCIRNNGGTIQIQNGTFTGIRIYNDKGTCTISNGKFAEVTNGIHYQKNMTGKLTIKNGTFQYVSQRTGTCTINGGKYSSFESLSSKENKTTIRNGNFRSTSFSGDTVIQNGTFNSIGNNGNLFIKNATINGGLSNFDDICEIKKCTLKGGIYNNTSGEIIIKGGTFILSNVQNHGKLTIYNGTFKDHRKYEANWLFINCPTGILTIKNGTFTQKNSNEYQMFNSNGIIKIENGKYESTAGIFLIKQNTKKRKNGVDLSISGGTFKTKEEYMIYMVRTYLLNDEKWYIPEAEITGGTFYIPKNASLTDETDLVEITGGTVKEY